MAKKAYIGVGGVARNIPKMYTGAYFGGSAGPAECILSGADTLLFSMCGRNFKKAYAGDTYAAFAFVGEWLWPLLVAKTSDAVVYKTDGDYESVQTSQTSFTYKGETWYLSGDGALFATTDIPTTTNVVNINAIAGVSSFNSYEEAARAVLNYVNWLPAGDNIARKIHKGYIGVNGVARAFYTAPVRNDLIVSAANKLLLSVGRDGIIRNFYKVNANPAICAYQKFAGTYNGTTACNFYAPILISEDPEAVKISVYEVESGITTTLGTNLSYQTTIQYRGKTWYVTREPYAVYDKVGSYENTVKDGVSFLNGLTGVSSYSSPDAGALALLKYYHYDI